MYVEHPFENLSHNFVYGTGPQECRVLMIGESPGRDEDDKKQAFQGRSGNELDRFYLPIAGLRRRDVRVNNLIPVYPYDGGTPTKEQIQFFAGFLERELLDTKPELVVPMGAFATKYFLPGEPDLHKVQGLVHKSSRYPFKILPVTHPAAGMHQADAQPLIVYGFQQVKLWLDGKLEDRPLDAHKGIEVYVELFTADDVHKALYGIKHLLMGQDTEGYRGNPWGLSFSTELGIAYVIRIASRDALQAFSQWLKDNPQCVVILHNALHDLPILREMGVHINKFEDTMVYAYWLCLEPQGLKDLAYRHCGMRMKSYTDVIEPAMRKLTGEYLIKVAKGDWGLDPAVAVMESAKDIKYSQPQALHKRAMKAVNDVFGMYVGTIVGPRNGGSARLSELGVRVDKVDHDTVARWGLRQEILLKGETKKFKNGKERTTKDKLEVKQEMNAWLCEVPIPVMPVLDALYGEFLWEEFGKPVVPEEPANPIKRWEAMCKDLEESVARAEEELGTLPETGLDALEDQKVAVDYSARDAHATIGIRNSLRKRIEAAGLVRGAEMDMATLPYLDRMRTVGLKVNRKHMLDYGEQLKGEMRVLQEKLEADLGHWINPSSPDQVAYIIYEKLGFPVEVRTETGKPSTGDKILEALAPLHKNIADITDYRELHKLRSTYALKLPRWTDTWSRVHPNYKYTRVASGRLALSDPNLLGIPTRSARGRIIRCGFVPEPGRVYISCDLSQIEVRVAAHFSLDPNLIKIFTQSGGPDFHTQTAMQMWGLTEAAIKEDDETNGGASMRSSAKNVSFGVLYGISAKGLQAQLKSKCHADWSEEQCDEMIEKWLDVAYPKVRDYMERQKQLCRTQGYVESMHGRRRYLPGANSTIPRLREEAFRAAINHPIQSTAAEILKIAQIKLWDTVLPFFWEAGVYVEPVLAVHDEIILECSQDAAEEIKYAVIDAMETAVRLVVPIVSKGKISRVGQDGGSWGDLK